MKSLLTFILVGWQIFGLARAAEAEPALRIFDGQPVRLHFTGNPHRPSFGQEKLSQLLNRYFEGKSPIRVTWLEDARKDPRTQAPIPPAKISDLGRFLEPLWEARAKLPEPRERLVVLNYVIVEEPRVRPAADWAMQSADAMQHYAQTALDRGASCLFFSEMVQPNHIQAGRSGNRFRVAGLQVFEELSRRQKPGILRGPRLQAALAEHRHFFRDDRHFSDTGRDYIGCLWFETLLAHDGLPTPEWCREEMRTLLEAERP